MDLQLTVQVGLQDVAAQIRQKDDRIPEGDQRGPRPLNEVADAIRMLDSQA